MRKCPSLPKVDKSAFSRQVGQIEKMGDYKLVQIEEVKRLEKSVNYKLFVIEKEFGQLGQIFLQFSRGSKIKVVQVVQKGLK